MTKSEMQWHAATYQERVSRALAAEQNGCYQESIRLASEAWENLDGTIRHLKAIGRDGGQNLTAIYLVLNYAPLLLDNRNLLKMADWLAENKRFQKNADRNVGGDLGEARIRLWKNYYLWSALELSDKLDREAASRGVGINDAEISAVLTAWEAMGLVIRQGEEFAFCTRMGEVIKAKCPACGKVAEAPKGMLLDRTACPRCKREVSFVILRPVAC